MGYGSDSPGHQITSVRLPTTPTVWATFCSVDLVPKYRYYSHHGAWDLITLIFGCLDPLPTGSSTQKEGMYPSHNGDSYNHKYSMFEYLGFFGVWVVTPRLRGLVRVEGASSRFPTAIEGPTRAAMA